MDIRKRVDLRIDANTFALLEEEAERRHCSLNWLIADICQSHIDAEMEERAILRRARSTLAAQIVADGHNSPTLAAVIKRSRGALADGR